MVKHNVTMSARGAEQRSEPLASERKLARTPTCKPRFDLTFYKCMQQHTRQEHLTGSYDWTGMFWQGMASVAQLKKFNHVYPCHHPVMSVARIRAHQGHTSSTSCMLLAFRANANGTIDSGGTSSALCGESPDVPVTRAQAKPGHHLPRASA